MQLPRPSRQHVVVCRSRLSDFDACAGIALRDAVELRLRRCVLQLRRYDLVVFLSWRDVDAASDSWQAGEEGAQLVL